MARFFVWLALLSSLSEAFCPTSTARHCSLTLGALQANYAEMSVETLEEELRSAHRKMFEMRLERQRSKKKDFKTHELRLLKKKIAQIMPVFEEKVALAATNEASAEE
mmetsp:Transcript_19253/g.60562  ORF Transcript_19253/g.60562 Transcript_19253/m.60562 type:complete len:108 (+) Transcript_19253:65-388(+)